MDLAAHQRAMLRLIRGIADPQPVNSYIEEVARSRDLAEARQNILLWRLYVLERTCVLTIALLQWRRAVEPTLEAFIRNSNISPVRESQPVAFLSFLANHPDPLVVCVSQFERALMKVREGDDAVYEIAWPFEPGQILHALARGEPLESHLVPGAFVVHLSRSLPHLFEFKQCAPETGSLGERDTVRSADRDAPRSAAPGADQVEDHAPAK